MDGHIFLNGLPGLIITSAVLIAVPGPSVMFFIGQVISAGRIHATRSVFGNALGMSLIAIILSLGLGELITRSEYVLLAIRLTGALFLIIIGLHYCRMKGPSHTVKDAEPVQKTSSFLSGAIVGFTNPKALIMFGVVVPSFLTVESASVSHILLVYSAIPILLGIFIDLIWVMSAHTIKRKAFYRTTNMRVVNIVGGLLIITMSLVLIWDSIVLNKVGFSGSADSVPAGDGESVVVVSPASHPAP